MTPRYHPTWNDQGEEVFIGHAGEIDLYVEDSPEDDMDWMVLVVGPGHRKRPIRGEYRSYNFDCYDLKDGCITPQMNEHVDIHVELAEMCEIYALLQAGGYMGEQND